DRGLHVRVRMHRVDEMNVCTACECAESLANTPEPLAEAFATVGGDHNQAFARAIQIAGRGWQFATLQAAADMEHGVDSRVPGDPHVLADAFAEEILRRSGRGR